MNDRDTIISNMLKAATVENERLTSECAQHLEQLAYNQGAVIDLKADNTLLRAALNLAHDRLILLLRAELPDSDHPVATKYIISRAAQALEQKGNNNEP